ncbi:MAG: hypothetical protein M3464_05425 [Chloroflexota bacterium]|nr:hypothetical protein [Chloroflexota bacterium]
MRVIRPPRRQILDLLAKHRDGIATIVRWQVVEAQRVLEVVAIRDGGAVLVAKPRQPVWGWGTEGRQFAAMRRRDIDVCRKREEMQGRKRRRRDASQPPFAGIQRVEAGIAELLDHRFRADTAFRGQPQEQRDPA